jgi:hypothetical protein
MNIRRIAERKSGKKQILLMVEGKKTKEMKQKQYEYIQQDWIFFRKTKQKLPKRIVWIKLIGDFSSY